MKSILNQIISPFTEALNLNNKVRNFDKQFPQQKRSVLLVTQWFEPEPTFKGMAFAKKLQQLGYEVSVLTGFPNYPGGKIYEGYKIKPISKSLIDGVKIYRCALYPSHNNSKLKRFANYISFALSAALVALFMRRPSVAYIYHPPGTIGLVAWVLKYFRNVPFVLDIQDLWPDSLRATEMIRSQRITTLVGIWMKRLYKDAAKIVVLSEGFKNRISENGIPPGKIEVIPNWADENKLANFSNPADLEPKPTLSVLFAGTLGRAQALENVIDAARILKQDSTISFKFIGDGTEKEKLVDYAKRLKLQNVEFIAPVPMEEIASFLEKADVLLVQLSGDPLFEITVPSKIQAYLFMGKPVLAGVTGEARRIIHESNSGFSYDSSNPVELVAAIKKFQSLSNSKRVYFGQNGKSYYEKNLSIDKGAEAFSQIFQNVIPLKPYKIFSKRFTDLFLSTLAITLFLIPGLIIGLLVRLNLGSPVIFKQERPGRFGQPFQMYKFRTMTNSTNEQGELLPDSSRMTKFGSFLRSSSLDELPELINVFWGQMSLVGPRPLLTRYTPFFTNYELSRFLVRPGITGLAQINGRNFLNWDSRLSLDVDYVHKFGLLLDLQILIATVRSVITKENLAVNPESVMQNLDDERRNQQSKK